MLKTQLFALIPILNVIGQWLKGEKSTDGTGVATYPKAKVKIQYIPYILIAISIVVSTAVGLILSPYHGWHYWADAILVTGVLHGLVAAFCAMGLYDTAKVLGKKG